MANIYVEKTLYTEDNEECRQKPFNEILFENISRQIPQHCEKPCRCNFGKFLNGFMKDIPFCKNGFDVCFRNVSYGVLQKIVQKPCTKVQYSGNYQSISSSENIAQFVYKFGNPAKVNVLEEYLIYDFITMIGSIGGTLGLCIGFSFSNLFISLISSFKVLTTKMTLTRLIYNSLKF